MQALDLSDLGNDLLLQVSVSSSVKCVCVCVVGGGAVIILHSKIVIGIKVDNICKTFSAVPTIQQELNK